MGYTHYWYRQKEIEPSEFGKILRDFRRVLPILRIAGVKLAGPLGVGEAVISNDLVAFNGPGHCRCGTFCFPRVYLPPEWRSPDGDGLWFSCCKTNFQPYDLAVTAFLLIAKRHLGDAFRVGSDGREWEWLRTRLLCHARLGYGMRYRFGVGGLVYV